jgi:hypothetical protein
LFLQIKVGMAETMKMMITSLLQLSLPACKMLAVVERPSQRATVEVRALFVGHSRQLRLRSSEGLALQGMGGRSVWGMRR